MYTITKQFNFSASHQLLHLPENHQCHRLHGHNYKVIIELQNNTLNSNGFIVDYGELKPLKDYINLTFDHRHLNDVLDIPTAENLAKHLFNWSKQRWNQVISISVSETDKTWAKYSENQ